MGEIKAITPRLTPTGFSRTGEPTYDPVPILDDSLLPQWEYHVEPLGATDEYGPDMAGTLDRLGIDGWELIGIHGTHMAVGVFKRQRIGMIAFDEETGAYKRVKPDR